MIKRIRRHSGAPQKGAARSRSDGSYKVGYGKPPEEHRFRPGQSGNRRGRPKGSKNTTALLQEILDRKIELRTGNSVRKISLREAMLTRLAELALKGDTKAAAFLLQRYDGEETDSEQVTSTTAEEQEIIRAYFETLQKKPSENR